MKRCRIICIISILSFTITLSAAEWNDTQIEKMAANAEETVRKAFDYLWEYREEHDIDDQVRDPQKTGVIGNEYTVLTTTLGYLDAKVLSTKPGWASWLVRDLARRGLWRGADAAISFSGSFPGLNIAVLAALQEFEVDLKGICSIGSSGWGANEPGFSYPEMERILREGDILRIGCSAVTLGGSGDRGSEWKDYAMKIALESVKRSRLPLLKPKNLRDAVKKRMYFYGEPAEYVIFINVGGGHATIGGGEKIRYTFGGWIYKASEVKGNPAGVMDKFLNSEVPCLNLLYIQSMNKRENIVSK